MGGEVRKFDAARYLDTVEDVASLLSDAVADGDPQYIAEARDAVARAGIDTGPDPAAD